MCGLVGVIGNNAKEINLKEALRAIQHRGPTHSGTQTGEEWKMGHNRLAILDLDKRSNQPFESYDGRYTLAFNGEIYNYRVLRSQLQSFGYTFRTASDTEVLLYAFDHWGKSAFMRFHGMFAFAVLDHKEKRMTMARDRFGEKPLYYSESSGCFLFASELRCLEQIISTKDLDHDALIDYLHFGFIPAPKTIYKNIFKLEPGHCLEYDISSKRILSNQPFYTLYFDSNNRSPFEEKKKEFETLAAEVASELSLADVPLAAFLSGGVDSSGAVYFLHRIDPEIQTFTAGFHSEVFDETRFAKKVVQQLHLKNTNKIIDINDFHSLYDIMIDHYGEPHNDFSFIPTYVISREASKDHTVMISGDGADEIFCGYPRYHKLRQFSIVKKVPAAARTIARLSRYLPAESDIRRQLRFAHANEVDFFFHTMSMNFQPNETQSILGPELLRSARHYSSRSIIERHVNNIPPESHLIQKQRYLDIKLTLAEDMLVKVDRSSMANSMEVRPFYLHPLITDFAFKLSVNDLATLNTDKAFLKKVFQDKLPREVLYRKKMGFTFPLRDLILGPLKELFNECISAIPPELVNQHDISRILKLHSKGQRDFTSQLHSLMALGRWIQRRS